jgi:signal transduction histidine kinase
VTGGSVEENAAAGTIVATLGAIDPDAGDSFTYTLAKPSALFDIVGNQLVVKTGATIDFEAASSQPVRVTVTDAHGLHHTETVTIAVTDQNEAPTHITMAGGSVQENAAAGTVVATLGAVDPDAGDSFTYSLAQPSALFDVVGNQLVVRPGANIDFETASYQPVQITVTDAHGLSHTETVTIAVANQNEAPTALVVSGAMVQENAAAGTVVATLGAADPDAGDTFTYTLAQPSALFDVVGNHLVVKPGASIDFEAASSQPVQITVTDAHGLSHTETVTIAVTDQNEAPTALAVSGATVQENSAAGTVVATLGAVDPDAGDSFTYTLAQPSALFDVAGNQLVVKAGANIDFEAASSQPVQITVTDAHGLHHTETVTIAVTDQNEAPTALVVSGAVVQENAAAGTVVVTLGAVDPDAGDSFTCSPAQPSGLFDVVGNQLVVKPVPISTLKPPARSRCRSPSPMPMASAIPKRSASPSPTRTKRRLPSRYPAAVCRRMPRRARWWRRLAPSIRTPATALPIRWCSLRRCSTSSATRWS